MINRVGFWSTVPYGKTSRCDGVNEGEDLEREGCEKEGREGKYRERAVRKGASLMASL